MKNVMIAAALIVAALVFPSIPVSSQEVPRSWLAAAETEPPLKFGGSYRPRQWKKMNKVFSKRYPNIKIVYNRLGRYDRVLKPLTAYAQGRVLTDLVFGITHVYHLFKKMDAPVDLRDLPEWKNIPVDRKAADGGWVGYRTANWCMVYNTNAVKPEDLPKTWEDLLTDPRWRKNNVGLSNRPNHWLANLWESKGEAWAKKYTKDLFDIVRPQLRKEGSNAMAGLTVAGEFDIAFPVSTSRAYSYEKKGAPLSAHCPDPAPISASSVMIMKGAASPVSAKIFLNWLLSIEGQETQFDAARNLPIRPDVKRFLYADNLVGKKLIGKSPEFIINTMPVMLKFWNKEWTSRGGKARRSRKKK